ncbi:MAG: hypothetical protein J6Y92_06710 [Lentisphaeria bacterium]|nr:hypothetical protein [Lentisphaeria bacterium]
MIAIRKIILSLAFLAVLLGGTGCFTHATLKDLGETRWSYSWDSTTLSPDESEVIIKYRKKTEHDCWPFLTLFHITWDTNSFEEVRTPYEKTDGEDFAPNQYPLYRYMYPGASIGTVGYCWKALWLPSAFVTDVVLLPVECIVTGCLMIGLLEELSHGQ